MRLTDQQKIEIVERYQKGESSISLARYYSISRQSILSILKIRKIKIRGKNGK